VTTNYYDVTSLPRLFSVAADWMSTILPHMVWPWMVRI